MSQENVDVVRRWTPVIEKADPVGFARMIDELFAPDAEWIEDTRWPSSATVRGRDAIKARAQEYFDGFDWQLGVEDVLDAGPQVLLLVQALGRGEASGIESHVDWACLLTFEFGALSCWRWFFDRSEALEAVGLRE